MSTAILWPTFLLVGLIFAVLFTLATKRFAHMRDNPPRRENFASSESMKAYFAPVASPANNLANLFEMPVLYFALVPLLLIFRHAGHIQVALAWAYVALRVAQPDPHHAQKRQHALHDLSRLMRRAERDVDRLRDRHGDRDRRAG